MPAGGANGTFGRRLRNLSARIAVQPEERALAGLVSGAFYMIGAVTVIPLIVLGSGPHYHAGALIAIAASAFVWSICSLLVIDWDRAPALLIHVSIAVGLGVVTAVVACSGGIASPAWAYTFYVVVFAAYFFPRPVAFAYLAACVAANALVLLYDDRARSGASVPQLVIASASFVAIGGAIIAGKALLSAFRGRAELLAAEQGALRRVATAVVGGDPPERIYELVAREAAALLGAGAAGILRFDSREAATVMGSWADHDGGRYPPGTVIEVSPASDVARARDTGAPIRTDGHAADSPVESSATRRASSPQCGLGRPRGGRWR